MAAVFRQSNSRHCRTVEFTLRRAKNAAAKVALRWSLIERVPWSRPLDAPIPLPGHLVTRKDAARYFQKLPAAEHQANGKSPPILMDTAGDRSLMHARIATLRALNCQVQRVFTDRKYTHWHKRKLKKGK